MQKTLRIAYVHVTLGLGMLVGAQPELPSPSSGKGVIRGEAGGSEIVIETTDRLAGAIHSLRWNRKEFIDSHDHGRQLQSAMSCGRAGKDYWAESFNPTEAGSRADGTGSRSSSRLLKYRAAGKVLETTTRMAFWLAPGEKSSGHPAANTEPLSEYLISKKVQIGHKDLPQVIDYRVAFTIPDGENHSYVQFEALTGYMPQEFERFFKFQAATGQLEVLDDGPGEQELPVVFATASGTHAMGVFSPDQPSAGYERVGYGRFRFNTEKVVKWNCVFRSRKESGVPAGEHRFRMFVAVGSKEDVRLALVALAAEFPRR